MVIKIKELKWQFLLKWERRYMLKIDDKITKNLSIEEEKKVTRFLDAIAEAYCTYYSDENRSRFEAGYDSLMAYEQSVRECNE